MSRRIYGYTCPRCNSFYELRKRVTLNRRSCDHCGLRVTRDEIDRQEASRVRREILQEIEDARLARESMKSAAIGCVWVIAGTFLFAIIASSVEKASKPKPPTETRPADPFPSLPRPTRPVKEEEEEEPRRNLPVATFPEVFTPRKGEPTFRPMRIGKGTLVVRRKTAVADYVPTWVEIDGKKAADWPAGEKEVKLSVLAGSHRVVVQAEFNGVVRAVHESTRDILEGQTALLDAGD